MIRCPTGNTMTTRLFSAVARYPFCSVWYPGDSDAVLYIDLMMRDSKQLFPHPRVRTHAFETALEEG